jgi:hypothetical protein
MLVEQGVVGMALVQLEGKTWVYLHMRWLDHPSHLMSGGESQNPLVEWYFGQNIHPEEVRATTIGA